MSKPTGGPGSDTRGAARVQPCAQRAGTILPILAFVQHYCRKTRIAGKSRLPENQDRKKTKPGRGRGTRTHDPRFWRPMLYQLSYTPRPEPELWQRRREIKGEIPVPLHSEHNILRAGRARAGTGAIAALAPHSFGATISATTACCHFSPWQSAPSHALELAPQVGLQPCAAQQVARSRGPADRPDPAQVKPGTNLSRAVTPTACHENRPETVQAPFIFPKLHLSQKYSCPALHPETTPAPLALARAQAGGRAGAPRARQSTCCQPPPPPIHRSWAIRGKACWPTSASF